MLRYLFIFVIFFVLLISFSVRAQEYSLSGAVDAAIDLSGDVSAARSELMQANELYQQALSYNRPNITGSGEWGSGDDNNSGRSLQDQDGARYSVSVQLNQNIYSFGRVGARKRSARHAIEAAEHRLSATKADVAERVSIAYATYVFREYIVFLREGYTSNIERQLASIEQHILSGTAKKTERARIKSQLYQSQGELRVEEAELYSAELALERLTGWDLLSGDLDSSGDIISELTSYVPVDADDAVSQVLEYSPMVLVALSQYRQSEAEASLANAELLPSLAIRGVLSESESANVKSSQALLLLSGSVHLFEGGLRYSQARQADAAVSSALGLLSAEKDRVAIEVSRLWSQIDGYKSGRISLNNSVIEANSAVDDTSAEVDAGSLPIIALTQTQKDLLDVKIVLAETELQYIQTVIALVKQLGFLTDLGSGSS